MLFVTSFAFHWLLLSFALSCDNDVDHQTNSVLGGKLPRWFLGYHFLRRRTSVVFFFSPARQILSSSQNEMTQTLFNQLHVLTLFISGSFRDWNGGLGSPWPVNQRVSWHLVLCFPFQSNTCITCYEPTALPLASLWSLVHLTDGAYSGKINIFQSEPTVTWPFPANVPFNLSWLMELRFFWWIEEVLRISRTYNLYSSPDAVPLKGRILIGVSTATLKQGPIICRGPFFFFIF